MTAGKKMQKTEKRWMDGVQLNLDRLEIMDWEEGSRTEIIVGKELWRSKLVQKYKAL